MPLPLPVLDTRRWADLVDEGRALLPRHAPGWTDHNVHDPGITLLELLAWLVEQGLYRVDQVPDRHRLEWLRLIGFAPRPPAPARTLLAFAPESGTSAFAIPAGTEFDGPGDAGATVPFRTLRDLTVVDLTLAAVQVDPGDGTLRDRTADWRERVAFAPFGEDPRPGAALYLGFSALPAGSAIALAFRGDGPGYGLDERARLMAEAAAQKAACHPVVPDFACGDAVPPDAATLPPHHSVRLAWEVLAGPDAWTRLEAIPGEAAPASGQVRDDTRALTLDGIVELHPPGGVAVLPLGAVSQPLAYLRCRIEEGAHDAPPRLHAVVANAVDAEQAVPAWHAFPIAAEVVPQGPAPAPGATTRLAMSLDGAGVIQALTFDPALADARDLTVLDYQAPTATEAGHLTLEWLPLEPGTGRPLQSLTLPGAPVVAETVRLLTHDGAAWAAWTLRPHFLAARRTDFHAVLEPTDGRLRLGDGERGRVAPRGVATLAAFHATAAGAGRLAEGVTLRPSASPRTALNLSGLPPGVLAQLDAITRSAAAASGGAPAETLAQAAARAVAVFHAHERLVEAAEEARVESLDDLPRERVRRLASPQRATTLLDYERLALDVPGTRVARARVWAGVHPLLGCGRAPGVVTVVVLPDRPVPRPEPSRGLLKAVRLYLGRRRLVGTRVEVVGPHYVEVQVEARVRRSAFTDPTRLRAAIRAALDGFLDPRHGGPEGRGWPFGRDVYRSEILSLVDGVPGVECVLRVRLRSDGQEPQCANLRVCPTGLVTPGEHRIEVE